MKKISISGTIVFLFLGILASLLWAGPLVEEEEAKEFRVFDLFNLLQRPPSNLLSPIGFFPILEG